MKSVSELYPGSYVRDIITSAAPGWSSFNPSIALHPIMGYRMIVRSSNYTVDAVGRYVMNDPDNVIRTKNYLAIMDSELNIVNMSEIDTELPDKKEPKFPLVRGLEDARLYFVDNETFMSGTSREHREDGVCQIAIDQLSGTKVTNRMLVDGPDPSRHEKNWSPITGTQDHRFVYTYEPAAVINRYGTVTKDDMAPSVPGAVRGGSQLIRMSDFVGRIAMTHEVEWRGATRYYWHRFVVTTLDGWVAGWSEPFYLWQKGIEFVAGLVEWKDYYVASFGFRDTRAMLAMIPRAAVIQSIPALMD